MSGQFFTGSTRDGSDALSFGMYLHPDGNQWSNMPWSDEVYAKHESKEERKQRKAAIQYERVHNSIPHLSSWQDEYELIKQKKSKLSRAQREHIINHLGQYAR